MNTLIVKGVTNKIFNNIRMVVFDMAGTTISENGIVYKTLYNIYM